MPKRLEMLEKLTASGKADSFTWYALALEYKSLDRVDDAMAAFSRLREIDPDYVPMYLMAGSMLQAAGRLPQAREWIRLGIEKAHGKGDQHAGSELSDLLDRISTD
jgi:tetratricopeptide (TPR) repeat protein